MTNLSDLLPAGAASKQLNFVATGAISNGQAVALKSDGTVSAITGPTGAEATFESAECENIDSAFDPDTGKIVVAYQDVGDSNKGKAVVGTVSGTTISFGSETTFSGSSDGRKPKCIYDTNSNKMVILYWDNANDKVYAIVGTVSGTSISFGSAHQINNADTNYISGAFDPDTNKVIAVFTDAGNSYYGTAIPLTVSGTSISGTTKTVFNSASSSYLSAVYDTSADRLLVAYGNNGDSGHGYAIAGELSGSSYTFGSAVEFEGAQIEEANAVFDTTNNKTLVVYKDQGNSGAVTGCVISLSGSTVSAGTPVVISAVPIGDRIALGYNPDTGKILVVWKSSSTYGGLANEVAISGTSLTPGTDVQVMAITSEEFRFPSVTYDTAADQYAIFFSDDDANTGNGFVYTGGPSNTSFLGIADAAISNGASGKITMKGGVATNSQLLPLAYTGSLGSAAVYESAQAEYQGMAFDSSNNRVVVAYKDDGNSSHGTAAVGTVSGTGITWGTPVVFEAASTSYVAVTFDSSNNKIVIAYSDVGNSEHGTAIVGTVSGTSISFGSPVVFAAAATTLIDATFDSNLNKVVISYRDGGNSSYGTAIVGTVSGTSISFGTEVVFNSGGSTSPTVTFDSSNNKVVVCYKTIPNNGNSKVGTVSGTSISFGSEANFSNNATIDNGLDVTFDSNSNKVVVAYEDTANSNYITAAVGTVSGTDITFGTPVVIDTTGNVSYPNISFDSNSNVVVAAYSISGTPAGRYAIGSVSGTSVSFETPVTFNTNYSNYVAITFDSSQNTTVIAYRDGGNSNYGTAKGLQITSGYPNLVPNTTYYVQDDGTLSTTSSSVTAGKAMSTNSINLDYST
jgi:hypothetical protein